MNRVSLKNALLAAVVVLTPLTNAAPRMARVVSVTDSRTIVVQRGSERTSVALAGIEPTDRLRGQQFLRWTLDQAWVMVEQSPTETGRYFVYRSPDGLFINREYVARGFAEPTSLETTSAPQTPMTYLGEVNPGRQMQQARGTGSRRSTAQSAAQKVPELLPIKKPRTRTIRDKR